MRAPALNPVAVLLWLLGAVHEGCSTAWRASAPFPAVVSQETSLAEPALRTTLLASTLLQCKEVLRLHLSALTLMLKCSQNCPRQSGPSSARAQGCAS